MRVLSLLASCTEIVAALGFESHLVGRSHECDFPESVLKLPVVTEPKFPLSGRSYDIHQRILAILQEGLSVYRVDAEKLAELAPDLILTQTQCQVCAVSEGDVTAAVQEITGSFPRVVSVAPNDLADVFESIRIIATALDCAATGEMLVGSMQSKMDAISSQTATVPDKPSIACIEWLDPLMAAGNWMPTLVGLAGGKNLFGSAGVHSPMLDWAQLRAADPDILLISPCGYSVAQSLDDIGALTARAGFVELRAVQNRRVYIADGNQYFHRPGPRLVDSLQILAEICYPKGFYFGFEGKGWQRYQAERSVPGEVSQRS